MSDNSFHKFEPAFIELTGGTVTASYTEGANGRKHHDDEIGQFHFFVTVVEVDGGRLGVWSGPDYEVAMRQAEGTRADFEVDEPVHDIVAGGRS